MYRLRETGLLEKLSKKWITPLWRKPKTEAKGGRTLNLADTQSVFIGLMVLMGISFCVLCFELFIQMYKCVSE